MIKIWFVDFWKDFDPSSNVITRLLDDVTLWRLDNVDPDILFCSCYGGASKLGESHKRYSCKKVFFTGENIVPNRWAYDFSFSFEPGGLRSINYRLPVWVLSIQYDGSDLSNLHERRKPEYNQRKFCNFLYGNDAAGTRKEFFNLLDRVKHVDSGGPVLNNMGYLAATTEPAKMAFLKNYRFTIAFENTSQRGYTTEKMIHPLMAGSVPIYWGNPEAVKDFNPNAFINCHAFPDFASVVAHVIKVDSNPDVWADMVRAPAFKNNVVPDCAKRDLLVEQLRWIVNSPKRIRNTKISRLGCRSFELWMKLFSPRYVPHISPSMYLRFNRFLKGMPSRFLRSF